MLESYLKQFKRNLTTLIKLIKKYEIPLEVKKLADLENALPQNAKLDQVFSLKLENITFNINQKLTGCLPNYIKSYVIDLHHSIDMNVTLDHNTDDIIDNYLFEIEVIGYDKDAEDYFFAWHLDKHDFEGDETLSHPSYHFQCWSDKLNHILEDEKFGKILLMNSPRFPHPPMDLFLGIHFIISNFIDSGIHTKKNLLLKDGDYQSILRFSQSLIWDVYFNSFADGSSHKHFTKSRVFPLYVE